MRRRTMTLTPYLLASLLLPSAAFSSIAASSVTRPTRIHPIPIMKDRGKENESRHRSKMQEKRKSSRGARANGKKAVKAQMTKVTTLEFGVKRRFGAKSSSRQQRHQPGAKPPRELGSQGRYTRGAGNPAAAAPINEAMVYAVLQQREAARRNRDYASADRLRAMLRMMGVEVRDAEGVWRYVGPPEQQTARSSGRDMFYLELFFRGLARYSAQNSR